MEEATTRTKKLKRPRNSSFTAGKDSNGSKRARHANAAASTAATTGNSTGSTTLNERETQLLAQKLTEMQNMLNSQLLLFQQEVTRKLDKLQEKVDQLVAQRGEDGSEVSVEQVAIAGSATASPTRATTTTTTPELTPAAITNNTTATANAFHTTHRTTTTAAFDDEDTREATLMARPKDLYALWAEYDVGSTSRKPAKLFLPVERGKVKNVYSKRKVFWDTVSVMVHQQGYSTESAIEAIYRDYGGTGGQDRSVTNILRRMLRKRTDVRNRLQSKGMPKGMINSAVMTAALPPSATGPAAGAARPRQPKQPLSKDTRPATLSKRPKDLFMLWEEYDKGLNGAKPAKLFTPAERGGKVKYMYYLRKIVWNAVSTKMQEEKCTSKTAIESIYNQYGGRHMSVTKIIRAMGRERVEDKSNR